MNHSANQNISISSTRAETFALSYFGISARVKALPGEADFNFQLKAEDGQAFTLKVSRPGTSTPELDFQADLMDFLSQKNLPFKIPKTVKTLDGKNYQTVSDKNQEQVFIRLQTWVDGRMLEKVNPRTPKLLNDWGRCCGNLSKALQNYDHPGAHRFYKWNPSETLHSRKHQRYFTSEAQKEIANYFWDHFEKKTLDKLPALRKSVNYNDAHEQNLLVNENRLERQISGIIDFGDALYSETINELAIACAYAMMHFPDSLKAATHVINGYHQIFPIQEQELELLFSLITARLLITVASSAHNKHLEPGNAYLSVSGKPAWELLTKLRNIHPELAHCTFRAACGLEPCANNLLFQDWITTQKPVFAPIIQFGNKKSNVLDLSVGSLDLGNNSNFDTIKKFNTTLSRMMEDADTEIGLGGYGEIRPFYTTDAYKIMGNSGFRWRTVHLGLDIWHEAGTPVFAPIDGIVHSFANNAHERDYGPTIILEHRVSEKLTFYTLYGHLSLDSLNRLKTGMQIKAGQQIATMGQASENGNWPPHLHFQIMLDMLGNAGDFPGVAFPGEKQIWFSLCPNPEILTSLNIRPSQNKQKTAPEILQIRKDKLGKGLSISYDEPLHIIRGYKQYLYDTNARRYLDTVNNVAHVGHEHPEVVAAMQRQSAVLNTNTRYLHHNIAQFAGELLATFPPELCVVHFVNSGSEANELAFRMLKTISGQKDMIAIEVGYHGNTSGCIDVSSYKFDGKGGAGAPEHTHILPMPDVFRGQFKNPSTAGAAYADYVHDIIRRVKKQDRNIAGFIGESILSCGGQIVLPEGYLREIYKAVHARGGLCIADEVQTGFGRCGEKFWAFELQDVIPDIVTLGKPIGNGHPLAAVVTTRKVADAFANGMEYFNTFGGNPVSCAVGSTVLKVIQNEKLQENALHIGNYLTEGLQKLQKKHPIIGDVRGPGLFLGIELIAHPDTLEPAAAQASHLANRMMQRGILMSTDGPYHNVLKIKPPLCFNTMDADFLLENLDFVLSEDVFKL